MSGKSFTLAVALPLITIGASNGQIADEKKAIQGMASFSGMVEAAGIEPASTSSPPSALHV